MTEGADGERFLATFAELRSAVADSPAELEASWEANPRLQELCDEVAELIRGFETVEDWSRLAFSPNVSNAGIKARRDYESRWKAIITEIANRELNALVVNFMSLLAGGNSIPLDDQPSDPIADEIAGWKSEARGEARQIEQLINMALLLQEEDSFGEFEWVAESLRAWVRLRRVCGLDVAGTLWRRRAVPHVLVPSHVAKHYGAKKASLYRRLDQAGKAFVFGAPLAALALQRAVIEEVLATHWGAEKGHIREAGLPELQWDARADRLKRLANDALHGDPDRLTTDALDRAIIENFGLLRLLIEQAPQDLHAHQRKAK